MPGPIICAKCGKALTLWEIDHGHKCRLDLDSVGKRAERNARGGGGQESLNGNTQEPIPLQICPGCRQRSLSRNMDLYECLNLECKRTFTSEVIDVQENTRQTELIHCKHCNQQFSPSDYETHLKLIARSARRGAVCNKCGESTYYLSHDGVWECLNPRCTAISQENSGSERQPLAQARQEYRRDDPPKESNGGDVEGVGTQRYETAVPERPQTHTNVPRRRGSVRRWLVGSLTTLCVVGGIAFFAVSSGWLQKEPSALQSIISTPTASVTITPTPTTASLSATPTQRPAPTPVMTATLIPTSTPTRTTTPSPIPTPQTPTPIPPVLDKTVTIDGQQYRVQFWKLDPKGIVEATVTLPIGENTNYGSNWRGFTLKQIQDNAKARGDKVAWAVALAAGADGNPATPTTTLAPLSTFRPLPTASPTAKATVTPNPTQTPVSRLQELYQYMLGLINNDRKNNGLGPVVLGSNNAAQKHAEDRLANNYSSHWGTDGMKPYMRYTLADGYNYDAENGFVTWTTWYGGRDPFYKRDPKLMLDEAEKSLMGSPGHRRNILDKWHKKVNLGIAFNNDSLHLAQDFEGDYITFTKVPSLSGNILSMAGRLSLSSLYNIALYYDPLPQPLTPKQLEAPPYDYAYGMGDKVGLIIPPAPPGSYYSSLPLNSIIASIWNAGSGGQFSITANISPALQRGKGVYTVMIWADINGESKNMTNYSIFVQ